jgi:hypothetical protein
MSSRAKAWNIVAAFVLLGNIATHAQQPRDRTGPSDDPAYDKVVNDFIKFDIGQIRDPLSIEQIKARFGALKGDDAVPALVRGLNASTRMRASCPITALSTKLRGIVTASKNPEVGTFVLQNLERNNAGQYTHYVNSIFDVAEAQVARTMGNGLAEQRFKQRGQEGLQRMAYTPGLKLTDLASRDPDESGEIEEAREKNHIQIKKPAPTRSIASRGTSRDPAATTEQTDLSKLSVDDVAARLNDRATQVKVLAELSRRASAGDEQKVALLSDSVVQCLKNGDDACREAAARLLGLVRSQRGVDHLIDALNDSNAKVRSAAATALTRITRQLFGPNDDATPEERQIAVAKWREWHARQSQK